MIGEDGMEAHGPRVENALVAKVAETSMAVYDLNLFADEDVSKDRKAAKNGGKGGAAVDDQMRDMVDLESVGEVADSSSGRVFVSMGDDDDLVPTIYQFLIKVSAKISMTPYQEGPTEDSW